MALTAKKVYAILKRQISDMEAKLNSPVRYRGTVATADLLPLNPDIGDMYNIESKSVYGEAGMNVAWNGVVWDTMGAPIDMSLYLTKEEAETVIQRLVTEYFEKNPVKPGATTEQAAQIEQNKKDVASLKEDISTKITKFYASSQGKTHLADSDNGEIMDMILYGKSEQKQYSGKSLTDFVIETVTRNGITCTNNGDGTYTLNGTAEGDSFFTSSNDFVFEQNKKYKIIGCPKGGSISTYRLDGSLNVNSDVGNGVTYTGDGNSRSIRIIVFKGVTANNLLFKPMIVDAEKYPDITYDDFEPYTGGQPSPSPDYPQEIKSVVNPTVKVCGKNLFNTDSVENGITVSNQGVVTNTLWSITDYIPALEPKMFIRGNVEWTTYHSSHTQPIALYDKDKKYINTIRISNVYDNYYTIPESAKYIRTSFLTSELEGYKFMIGFGDYSNFEPYHEQTVTLPYTLNAIPVSSGGNVTIDGQQYIADYVDVERGKLVKMVEKKVLNGTEGWGLNERSENRNGVFYAYVNANIAGALCDKAIYESPTSHYGTFDTWYDQIRFYAHTNEMTLEEWHNFLSSNNHVVYIIRNTPEEIDLTPEEIAAFKALATYYPTTNISVNSEQLDGYTVFNYPVSMANGWNYVKQQIGDTRDYIYDMDARAQDTDLQAAEAYVNSEYAVVLTELEV